MSFHVHNDNVVRVVTSEPMPTDVGPEIFAAALRETISRGIAAIADRHGADKTQLLSVSQTLLVVCQR